MPDISNADILESTYKTRDALNSYVRVLGAVLEEQGFSEQERNVQVYRLTDKLGAASEGFFPGIVTLTLAYNLGKFLDYVIQNSTPAK